MPYAKVNGQRIYQIEAFADDYRIVTSDQRGFGQTEFDSQPFSYWDSADDCLGLLDDLALDRVVLGRMSQGGFISLPAALKAPERVRALILMGTQSGGEDPANVPMYQGMLDDWISNGPSDELGGASAVVKVPGAHAANLSRPEA